MCNFSSFAKHSLDELQQAEEQCGFVMRIVPIANGKSYCTVYTKMPMREKHVTINKAKKGQDNGNIN